MFAAQGGHDHVLRALIEAKADVEHTLEGGWTCLMKACENGHDQVARAMLEAGAAVDAVQEAGGRR